MDGIQSINHQNLAVLVDIALLTSKKHYSQGAYWPAIIGVCPKGWLNPNHQVSISAFLFCCFPMRIPFWSFWIICNESRSSRLSCLMVSHRHGHHQRLVGEVAIWIYEGNPWVNPSTGVNGWDGKFLQDTKGPIFSIWATPIANSWMVFVLWKIPLK